MKYPTRTMLWIAPIALAVGFVVGRMWSPVGTGATTTNGTPAAAATATREAELLELEQLRTQVAELETACAATPTPTPTATATPPLPAAQGEPVPYGEGWTLEVTGASSATSLNQDTPKGLFIVINLTVTNNGSTARAFSVTELTLRDEQGRIFVSDPIVSSHIETEHRIGVPFDPSLPTDTAVVFDVAPDVGAQFILESKADPTFRVQVTLEMRG